jgi:hypothetical protein
MSSFLLIYACLNFNRFLTYFNYTCLMALLIFILSIKKLGEIYESILPIPYFNYSSPF